MPNIVVLVKRVPDTNARIVVSGDRVDLSSVKWVISPYDEFAIETALQHKEADGGTVTALTLGNSDSDKVLKDAKAIGVDEIVRVWNDSWTELDSNGVQSALAQAITNLGAEVVYCGKTAADTGAGSTGPGIAERLGWASVSNITDASFAGDAGNSKSITGGLLCLVEPKTFVPLNWRCKKKGAVSHSSTGAEIVG